MCTGRGRFEGRDNTGRFVKGFQPMGRAAQIRRLVKHAESLKMCGDIRPGERQDIPDVSDAAVVGWIGRGTGGRNSPLLCRQDLLAQQTARAENIDISDLLNTSLEQFCDDFDSGELLLPEDVDPSIPPVEDITSDVLLRSSETVSSFASAQNRVQRETISDGGAEMSSSVDPPVTELAEANQPKPLNEEALEKAIETVLHKKSKKRKLERGTPLLRTRREISLAQAKSHLPDQARLPCTSCMSFCGVGKVAGELLAEPLVNNASMSKEAVIIKLVEHMSHSDDTIMKVIQCTEITEAVLAYESKIAGQISSFAAGKILDSDEPHEKAWYQLIEKCHARQQRPVLDESQTSTNIVRGTLMPDPDFFLNPDPKKFDNVQWTWDMPSLAPVQNESLPEGPVSPDPEHSESSESIQHQENQPCIVIRLPERGRRALVRSVEKESESVVRFDATSI